MNASPGVPPDAAVLRTERLGRRVGEVWIVSEISLAVQRGELLGVVGPSGSGKSSFLRLLNRLDEPTSGMVFLEDEDYRRIPPRQLRRRIGMVTQRPFLFPGDIASNLRFGPAQRGETLPDNEIAGLLERPDSGEVTLADVVAEVVAEVPACWSALDCPASPAATSPIFPAASSSASHWPAHWPTVPRSCCSTSQPRRSTSRRRLESSS